MINEAVCEGCGDCGVKSNCLSVQPVDTEFGRKTRIDQTSCNTDYSCLDGDCPSFVTVEVAPGQEDRAHRGLPEPPVLPDVDVEPVTATHNVFLAGIGGTGIVTVNQVLATAALRAGYDVESLDQIGLSQKAGPVVSHLTVRSPQASWTRPTGSPPAARTASSPSICWPRPTPRTSATATRPRRSPSRRPARRRPARWCTTSRSAIPRPRYLLNRLGQVSRDRALLRRAGRRRARCSAARPPPTSCSSAPPIRLGRCGFRQPSIEEAIEHQRRRRRGQRRRLPLGTGRHRRPGPLRRRGVTRVATGGPHCRRRASLPAPPSPDAGRRPRLPTGCEPRSVPEREGRPSIRDTAAVDLDRRACGRPIAPTSVKPSRRGSTSSRPTRTSTRWRDF